MEGEDWTRMRVNVTGQNGLGYRTLAGTEMSLSKLLRKTEVLEFALFTESYGSHVFSST